MMFNKNLKNILLVIFATLILSACSTAKKSGNIDGDVYTGKETVKFLAAGVPDRGLRRRRQAQRLHARRAAAKSRRDEAQRIAMRRGDLCGDAARRRGRRHARRGEVSRRRQRPILRDHDELLSRGRSCYGTLGDLF